MNRRRLLQGVVAGAAGLLLPPSVGEAAAAVERRYWALGAMPGRGLVYPDYLASAYLETQRFDADVSWHTIVLYVDRTPYEVMVPYVKVPIKPTTFSVTAHWVK